ncbi:MAG: sugar-binding transcriptional regulator [Armatimonadetes bacterium]|nr:sugar-binding transcriptional regulator [Armatimonadota bacterium]
MEPTADLMTRAAALYYLEDATQAEVALRLGLSRPKVGRLLRQARDLGIVTITVHAPPAYTEGLERELAARFGLLRVLLATDQPDPGVQRSLVAQAAAEHLLRNLRAGMTVAVGMGRNVGAVAEAIRQAPARRCTLVTAIGGSPAMARGVDSGDICRTLAERFGGTGVCLYAPAYAETASVRDAFLQHEDVDRTLRLAAQAEMAIVGIGDARNESAVVRMGCFSRLDMIRMRQAGAVGDILGSFFDVHGQAVAAGMRDRVISIGPEDLRRIGCVVAVASEAGKGRAILGALRSGMVKVLATSASNAREVIRLDSETDRSAGISPADRSAAACCGHRSAGISPATGAVDRSAGISPATGVDHE